MNPPKILLLYFYLVYNLSQAVRRMTEFCLFLVGKGRLDFSYDSVFADNRQYTQCNVLDSVLAVHQG